MPIFSSDSEDEVAPSSKLFSRERSVHTLLGGGQVADVLLWRDKKISSAILAAVTIIWFLFEVVEYNFITLLCHIFITSMLIIFIWSTAADLFNWAPPQIPKMVLQDSIFRDVASTFHIKFNKLLFQVIYIACGNDLKVFAMAVLLLWLVSLIGNYISSLNLLFLGILSLETLPFLYERYEKEVDYLVGKVYRRMRKIYRKFDSKVLDKIPRGPMNGKKAK
ncbi:reticulon-like protein B9 [Apium graveolens]|uniref:reticulon-like protein B9 n=1 Tax=Apium graveolens TaxID=4045 RepID=UPI003D79A5D6